MGTIHLVFGPQGAGKSTYSRQLATRIEGVRFSIDDWMGQLYGPDLPKPLNFSWIMERVQRCEQRIWATVTNVAQAGGNVVLDLGFMKVKSRNAFLSLAAANEHPTQLHFVNAPHDLRRSRVLTRNTEKGETFSFEVTAPMFDFMEREYEPPQSTNLQVPLCSIHIESKQIQRGTRQKRRAPQLYVGRHNTDDAAHYPRFLIGT